MSNPVVDFEIFNMHCNHRKYGTIKCHKPGCNHDCSPKNCPAVKLTMQPDKEHYD